MTSAEFIYLFLEQPFPYFIILGLLSVVFIPIIRRLTTCVIDPLFLALIHCILASVIPFYLYIIGYCSQTHLSYFVISESIFWFTIYTRSKRKFEFKRIGIIKEDIYLKNVFIIALIIFTFSSLYTYYTLGAAYLMDSRLELYSQVGGGIGILGRLNDFSICFLIMYTYHRFYKYKQKKFYLLFPLILVQFFLTGEKSSVLLFLTWFYVYKQFYLHETPKIRLIYIVPILLFPIIILSIRSGTNESGLQGGFIGLFYRFMCDGEGFWKAYPYNVIDTIHYRSPFLAYFKGILATFRIVPYNEIEQSIGTILQWNVEPLSDGIEGGPNARLPIMGWVFFKWGGLLFSLFVGYISYFFIFKIKKYFNNSFVHVFIYGMIFTNAISMLTDPALFWGGLATIIINSIIYYIIFCLASSGIIRYYSY